MINVDILSPDRFYFNESHFSLRKRKLTKLIYTNEALDLIRLRAGAQALLSLLLYLLCVGFSSTG